MKKPVQNYEIPEYAYGHLKWQRADPSDLVKHMVGSTIAGIEPIDAPVVDGYIITIRNTAGKTQAVRLAYDETDRYEFIVAHMAAVGHGIETR